MRHCIFSSKTLEFENTINTDGIIGGGKLAGNQRHKGEDLGILAARKALYEAARKKRPERWSRSIRDWEPTQVVFLNLKKSKQQAKKAA